MGVLLTDEQRQKIFKPLIKQIKSKSNGHNGFKVFDYEAALGKTHNYCKAIVEVYHAESDTIYLGDIPTSLIVIKTKKEGQKVADLINVFDEEYKCTKSYKQFAIAINGDKGVGEAEKFDRYDSKQIEGLKEYPCIVITQSRYLNICKNKVLGHEMFGDRKILIVDEEIDFVQDTFRSITVKEIANIEEDYLKYSTQCQAIFKDLVKDIRITLAGNNEQMSRAFLEMNIENLNRLTLDLKNNIHRAIDETYVRSLSRIIDSINENMNPEDVRKKINDKIDGIVKFYNNENVLIYRNGLYRYDQSISPFLLQNNIWIDASAKFNHLYGLNKNFFKVYSSGRIVEHNDCTIYIDESTKSTSSGKEDYVDLERDILRHISDTISEKDNILIIDNKRKCVHIQHLIETEEGFQNLKKMNEIIDEKSIEAVNFSVIRGSNTWGHYNKCYIIQQPQMLFPYYVFLYEYWTGVKLANKEIYIGNYVDADTGYGTFGFTTPKTLGGKEVIFTEEEKERNMQLELLRQTSQVSSIYQGFKRIQRNLSPKGDFYVITTDKKMISLLIDQFKGIQTKYHKFKIEYKDPGQAENTVNKRLNNWINEIDEKTEISYKELAILCNTSLENLKKTISRHKNAIERKLNLKKITIYNGNEAVEWLRERKIGEEVSKKEFEDKFKVIWKKFKRTNQAKNIIDIRKIVVVNGIIRINS